MTGRQITSQDNHEAPDSLKKLVRVIVRAFYSREHSIVMDMLVRNTIMKEDDLCDRLLFEKKQLRTVLNTLKTDQLLKTRIVLDTDSDGRSTRVNYFYIDYKLFVNVVKYRLDRMRHKLECEERQSTSRASFKCPDCGAMYTDLEVNSLLDPTSGTLLCTYCHTEVVEEEDNASRIDARAMMGAFNNQVREPIDIMLQDCEGIHLSSNIMEPEIRILDPKDPVDANSLHQSKSAPTMTTWSGDASRNVGFGATESSLSVTFGDSNSVNTNQPKERPKWLTESTIPGGSVSSADAFVADDSVTQTLAPGRVPTALGARDSTVNSSEKMGSEEVMQMLLVCERKHMNQLATANNNQGGTATRKRKFGGKNRAAAVKSDDSSSDDADNSLDEGESAKHHKRMEHSVTSDQRSDIVQFKSYHINLGGRIYQYEDITADMIRLMTPEEKLEYIRVGREIYSDIYE